MHVPSPTIGINCKLCGLSLLHRYSRKPPAMAEPDGAIMEVGDDGVAVIFISNPPANILTLPIVTGLKKKFDEASIREDVKAIVVAGKSGRFCGGLDINVLKKLQDMGDISLFRDVVASLRIEDCKKPVVAAIERFAIGGGLEMTLQCHARIASPKTQLSLPELKLGIIPAYGGTQRLPRLVGIPKAIELLLQSKTIKAEEGREVGLIDAVVPSQDLIKVSRLWALDIAAMRKPWIRTLQRADKLSSLGESREILKAAKQQVQKATPDRPHYQACLDVIEEGVVHGVHSGISKEVEVFEKLLFSNIAKDFVLLFFAQRTTSKNAPRSRSSL